MPTISQQADRLETRLTEITNRLHEIELSLRKGEGSEVHRKILRVEKKNLSNEYTAVESDVKKLRRENMKTMLFSSLIVVLFVIIYVTFT